ncbi:MAG TPA: hypothetical protein V6D33_02150 [Cyanophyceae cyanobacterium]
MYDGSDWKRTAQCTLVSEALRKPDIRLGHPAAQLYLDGMRR